MHPNAQCIHNFYTAFQNLDAGCMKECYHQSVQFSDPAFPNLQGNQVGAMWSMLIENLKKGGGKWQLDFSDINADDNTGTANWEAHYTLSVTGNRVHNRISARFQFHEGKIIRHEDTFDFYRWARMAFGIKGVLLGWAPFFQQKVQSTVNQSLTKYIAKTGN